ncbi:MAG: PilZ domain-containing protein [Bdellovibrionales bacterium]|nr:PilZ domain-containing protein [Bdellovibrionales bacterium]
MSQGKLVQISEARRDKQEKLKREYERVLFNRILGSYTYIEKLGLKSVEVLDISKSGCSFRMPYSEGAFALDEELDFRFYFSNSTYLPCRIIVKRVMETEENSTRYWQFGCAFDTALSNYQAVDKFVEFINAYSLCAKEDKGEKRTWYL